MFSKFRNSKTHTGNNSAHPKFSEYRQKGQNYGYRQTHVSSRQPTQKSINSQMVSHLTGRRKLVFRNTLLAIAKAIFAARGSKLSNEDSKSATSQSNSSTNGFLTFLLKSRIVTSVRVAKLSQCKSWSGGFLSAKSDVFQSISSTIGNFCFHPGFVRRLCLVSKLNIFL